MTTTVRLASGGTLTLTVNVNPLTLKGADRQFFFKIVDEFDAYETQKGAKGSTFEQPAQSAEGDLS